MSLLQSGPRLVARSMETTIDPGNGKKNFIGSDVDVFIDGQRIGRVTPVELAPNVYPGASDRMDELITSIAQPAVLPPPSHWPPRITRMCLAVRLGITRLLLERRP